MEVVIEKMQASVVDLRYKTKAVLECLRRGQKVDLTCRGKIEGVIMPVSLKPERRPLAGHPAVGMWKDQKEPVPEMIKRMRKPRFHAH